MFTTQAHFYNLQPVSFRKNIGSGESMRQVKSTGNVIDMARFEIGGRSIELPKAVRLDTK
jgi:hypothetical protein